MVFANFSSLAPVSEQTVARHAPNVPAEIVEVWRTQGAGLVGDGFVRVVDPDRALTMTDGVLGLPPTAVPVFTTAFADVIIFLRPFFHVLRFRFGVIDMIGFDAARLMADIETDPFLDDILVRSPYAEGVARLGVPGLDQCFGFVPILTMGGTPDPRRIDLGGLWEHVALISQLTGPPVSRT